MSLRVCVLASGSKANSLFLECDDTRVLVDVGIGIRALPNVLNSIGERLESISAAFITHEHTDHTRGLMRFLDKSRASLYASSGTLEALDAHTPARIRTHVMTEEFVEVGPFSVRAHQIPHDAADPVAYEILAAGERIVVATDLGEVPAALAQALAHATIAVFESNHDEALLWSGSYPEDLKVRIASANGHLSNDQCADALTGCKGNGLKHAVLAHLSEENNHPNLAEQSAVAALSGCGAQVHVTTQLTLGPMIAF